MEKEFLHHFYPRILDVTHRNEAYWEEYDYHIVRPVTNVFNLVFIYKGEGVLILNGERFELRPGCVFHVNPQMSMDISTTANNTLQYYGVQFHQLHIQWEGSECESSITNTPLPFKRVLILPTLEFLNQATQLYECWHSKSAGYEWQAKLKLFQLLDALCNVVIAEQTEQEISYRQMEDSVRFIRQHYSEDLNRTILAKQTSMSVSHYSLLFKNAVGISPLQFVEKVRIDQAKSMLTSTSKPISEVAKAVGYSDPLYFTRVFTKVTGMAPREYRGS